MKKPSNLDKDREGKTEGGVMRRGTNAGSRTLPALVRQISGHLPASGSIEN